jgi:SAM-dependent methyltransferase
VKPEDSRRRVALVDTHMFARTDDWADGDAYESFMGRWSRATAARFISWLALPHGLRWLDVGCGTGALSGVILERASPKAVLGIDRSHGYVAHARSHIQDGRARFEVSDAASLPVESASFEVAVSGLVLNFVTDPHAMLGELARAVGAGGRVAVYVWDYADGMGFLRHFWNAAIAVHPPAAELDEGRRFPICQRESLLRAFEAAGLGAVEVSALEVPTWFRDFEAYWSPFLGGQGPAPGFVKGLTESQRARLRERLRRELPQEGDGSIQLMARAWAARGIASATA